MRRSLKLLAATALVGGIAGPMTAGPAAAAEKKPVTIALFVAIQANPVEQAIINNFKQVAQEDGAAKFVVFDSNTSVQKEIANCKDAIASKKFDGFALKPVAGAPLINCAREALAAGIPVVAFGVPLGPSSDDYKRQIPGLAASVIELSNYNGIAVAALAEEACKAKHANPCKVIYTYGPLAFDYAAITRKYFESLAASKYTDIKIVAEGSGNFDPNTTRTLVKSLVQAHPDVDVIVNDGDLGAIGAIQGLKDVGKQPGKDVLVTGGAFSKIGKGLVLSGQMFGTTCLLPTTESQTAAKYSIRAARHETIDKPDVEVCDLFAPTGNEPLTAANIGKMEPQF